MDNISTLASRIENFDFFTTFRHDPYLNCDTHRQMIHHLRSLYYMISLHYRYLRQTCILFNWPKAIRKMSRRRGLSKFISRLNQFIDLQRSTTYDRTTSLWIRVIIDIDGNIRFQCGPVPFVDYHSLYPNSLTEVAHLAGTFRVDQPLLSRVCYNLHISSQRIQPSMLTCFKTSRRTHYLLAQQEAGIQHDLGCNEVLLFNLSGAVMDGSFSSVYFWRDEQWITPSLNEGGLNGITRSWALENRLCVEGTILCNSLADGELCCISSGFLGFLPARIRFRTISFTSSLIPICRSLY